MDESPYDISHLLAKAAPQPAPRPARSVMRRPPEDRVEAAQQAMAQELLVATAAHEEMIRQYLGLRDGTEEDG